MLRITKQADYGIVLLTFFAREEPGITLTASELAKRTYLPAPTVTKVLKLMAREGLLISHRGVQGGYQLAREPKDITVIDIIAVLDGPVAFTQCAANAQGCAREPICPVRPNWRRLDVALRGALKGISLAEMAEPADPGEPGELAIISDVDVDAGGRYPVEERSTVEESSTAKEPPAGRGDGDYAASSKLSATGEL